MVATVVCAAARLITLQRLNGKLIKPPSTSGQYKASSVTAMSSYARMTQKENKFLLHVHFYLFFIRTFFLIAPNSYLIPTIEYVLLLILLILIN